ncbi:MAG: hypothetical protein HY663_07370 [Chloroflexi bacterium]|nr:hypothetical protein [Chloroflexota bacterium]
MSTKYTHLEVGKDVSARMGYYSPQKETRLRCDGREVLYVVGEAVVEGSCCVPDGSWVYVTVPGYIVNWQNGQNETGLPVSEVEPIADEEAQANIRRTIEANEGVSMVGFW